jgi:hypothetical protein
MKRYLTFFKDEGLCLLDSKYPMCRRNKLIVDMKRGLMSLNNGQTWTPVNGFDEEEEDPRDYMMMGDFQ